MSDENIEIVKRGPGRPPLARPDLRSEPRLETRETVREQPRLHRRFKSNDDRFHIPQSVVDEFKGMGYELEWKRHSIKGETEDYYHAELALNYWEPVQIEKYPHIVGSLVPQGRKSGAIVKADQMLMMRPDYLSQDARDEQKRLTDRVMHSNRSKMKEAPSGTFERLTPEIRKTSEAFRSEEVA